MLAVGTMVMYGKNGVCRITDMAEKKVGKSVFQYYVLSPEYKRGLTFFVPVTPEGEQMIRPILTADEVRALISAMPEMEAMQIDDERERRAALEALIARGDRGDLVRVIKTIYKLQQERGSIGKRLCTKDEQLYSQAQKMLYDEFAAVLDMDPEEVLPMILGTVEEAALIEA